MARFGSGGIERDAAGAARRASTSNRVQHTGLRPRGAAAPYGESLPATVGHPIHEAHEVFNPNYVKVVLDA
ncbi:hypothetical protein ACGYRY_18985, partial [Burkholderia pseudomallei]